MSSHHSQAKACGSKKRHETRELAMLHAAELYHDDGDVVHPYHCRFCGHWHVGHRRNRPGRDKVQYRQHNRAEQERMARHVDFDRTF